MITLPCSVLTGLTIKSPKMLEQASYNVCSHSCSMRLSGMPPLDANRMMSVHWWSQCCIKPLLTCALLRQSCQPGPLHTGWKPHPGPLA